MAVFNFNKILRNLFNGLAYAKKDGTSKTLNGIRIGGKSLFKKGIQKANSILSRLGDSNTNDTRDINTTVRKRRNIFNLNDDDDQTLG